MNLWKLELRHLFRGWRGWTFVAAYLLATMVAVLVGTLIDRFENFSYAGVIDLYFIFSIPASILFIGLVVSSLSFDGNKNLSAFLRLRFSIKNILVTKLLTYFVLNQILFLLGFIISFIIGIVLFDSADTISLNWVLWGLFFSLVAGLFYIALISFTSAIFTGTIASVLLTLAVVIGVPIVESILTTIELLIRGLITTPPDEWGNISYVQKVMMWWPTATSDANVFFSVTQSEIASDRTSGLLGSYDLDPYFRIKPLITSLIATPLLIIYAWRKYSQSEI